VKEKIINESSEIETMGDFIKDSLARSGIRIKRPMNRLHRRGRHGRTSLQRIKVKDSPIKASDKHLVSL